MSFKKTFVLKKKVYLRVHRSDMSSFSLGVPLAVAPERDSKCPRTMDQYRNYSSYMVTLR